MTSLPAPALIIYVVITGQKFCPLWSVSCHISRIGYTNRWRPRRPFFAQTSHTVTADRTAIRSIPAHAAAAFLVETGANMGDPLGVLEDLVLDDVYMLAPGATAPQRLHRRQQTEVDPSVLHRADPSVTAVEEVQLHVATRSRASSTRPFFGPRSPTDRPRRRNNSSSTQARASPSRSWMA